MLLRILHKKLHKRREAKENHDVLITTVQGFGYDDLSASLEGTSLHDSLVPEKFVDFISVDDEKEVVPCENQLPVVDMAKFQGDDVATLKQNIDAMVSACKDWGYFLLINHGADLTLMEKVEEQAYDYFLLPGEEKPKQSTVHVSLREKVKRWSEGLFIKPSEGNLDEYDNKLSPPGNNKEFSTTVKEYDVVMKKLAIRIVSLLVEGLGVKPWHFATYVEGMEAALRWNYQPPSPKPEKAVGCSPHTNPYLITLQHDSGTGGLQVERDGKWFGVPLRADALIVNVGDAFQILSNGILKSPVHRTVVTNKEGRLSIAHCLSPAGSVPLIPPLELLVSGANLYKTWTFEEFMGAKKRNPGTSLDFVKVPTHI